MVDIKVEQDALLKGEAVWVVDPDEQHLVGTDLFADFERDNCAWQSGTILNPENGRRYHRSKLTLRGGHLHVKACLGLFCQTQRWRRYERVLAGLPPAPTSRVAELERWREMAQGLW